jgi:hypothetical protein
MRITSAGNVGIGTTSVTADYDKSVILYGGNPSYIVQTNDNTGYGYFHIKTPSYDWSFGYDGANNFKISNGTHPASSTKFTIASSGAATFSSSVTAGAEFKQPEGGGGGIYIKNGSFVLGGGSTVAFYAFTNLAKQSHFQVIICQRGSASNTAIAYINMYSTSAAAYTIYQDNTNPVLFLTLNMSGLDLRLTTGSGYGSTTWEYTITQIK